MFTPFRISPPLARVGITLSTIVAFLGTWFLLRMNNPIIPAPMEVIHAWVRLGQEGLLFRLLESYTLNVIAMGISMVISFVLAYLTVVDAIRPTVETISKLRFLGFTGLTFVLGMYAEGRNLQIVMLVFGISTFFTTSMMAVVASVPQARLDHARTLRMSPWRTLWEVVVLGTMDQSLDVLRQSAAIGWVMLTMVEGLVRSQGGIGLVLIDLNRRLLLDGILAVILTILVIGIAQDYLLNQLRLIVCPHVKN